MHAPFLIQSARLFDGDAIVERADILVRDGLIAAITDAGAGEPALTRIDATGHTLLPGLIDAHVHAWGPLARALNRYITFGVTTVFEMQCDGGGLTELLQLRAEDAPDQAQIFSSGFPVTVPHGHGTEFGFEIPTVEDVASMQEFVDARIAEGSDYIKIMYSNRQRSPHTLTRQWLDAAIIAAHARGKLAIVHASVQRTAAEAVEAGANVLAHVFLDDVDPAFADHARQRGVNVVPTLAALLSVVEAGGAGLLEDQRLSPYLTSFDRRWLALGASSGREAAGKARQVLPATWNFDNALAVVARLRDAGVPLLAGTDAPNPGTTHGVSLHHELELLVQAGLTPVEALRAATSVPARTFGLANRGKIAPGLRADLLLVRGEPTKDMTATRDIASVWKAGTLLDRRVPDRSSEARDAHD